MCICMHMCSILLYNLDRKSKYADIPVWNHKVLKYTSVAMNHAAWTKDTEA